MYNTTTRWIQLFGWHSDDGILNMASIFSLLCRVTILWYHFNFNLPQEKTTMFGRMEKKNAETTRRINKTPNRVCSLRGHFWCIKFSSDKLPLRRLLSSSSVWSLWLAANQFFIDFSYSNSFNLKQDSQLSIEKRKTEKLLKKSHFDKLDIFKGNTILSIYILCACLRWSIFTLLISIMKKKDILRPARIEWELEHFVIRRSRETNVNKLEKSFNQLVSTLSTRLIQILEFMYEFIITLIINIMVSFDVYHRLFMQNINTQILNVWNFSQEPLPAACLLILFSSMHISKNVKLLSLSHS